MHGFPSVFEIDDGSGRCLGPARWSSAVREGLEKELRRAGAVLLRRCRVASPEDFEAFLAGTGASLADYAGGNSPRTRLTDGGVYTSTEYPRELEISLHNELSYASRWPATLYFACLDPADSGGETTLADGRRVLERIDAAVRRRFERRGVRYVRNLHPGLGVGRSWQATFETGDPAIANERCRDRGLEFQWKGDGGLRVSQRGPGVQRHPHTGEAVWFNQAEQWHVSSLDAETERFLRHTFDEEDLPQHAFFGDGSPIPREELEHVRTVLHESAVPVALARGDVLLLDNHLVLHGRRPFTGDRLVLVAMSG